MVFKAILSTQLHRHTHNELHLQAPSPQGKGFSNTVLPYATNVYGTLQGIDNMEQPPNYLTVPFWSKAC